MTKKNDTKRNIWDLIFSLDSTYFPIQRNYPQEPRGSLNPINCQMNPDICQKTVEEIKKTITDPNDLYALDYELNYVIRKLSDFTLFSDIDDLDGWLDTMGCPAPDDMVYTLEKFLKQWGEDKFICIHDLMIELFHLGYNRERLRKGEYDREENPNLLKVSNFQSAVQFLIENSKLDWRAKAEAFLRASSVRGYGTADDEAIIYLIAQNIDDKELNKEAKHRWKCYKNEWSNLFFTEMNPFTRKFIADGLRFIHWDKSGKLRPLEPQLDSSSRDTYGYMVESQHLLSPAFMNDYSRVFSLFRTDLNVDPIRTHLPKLIKRFYTFLSGKRNFEYNYTVSDLYYLSDLLFTFATNRFKHDMLENDHCSRFVREVRDEIDIMFRNSTVMFNAKIPMTTLIALEVHSIYFSCSEGMVPFLQKAKEWLLNQQSSYGYWYDGVNNPEFTTVLVLDALSLIDGNKKLSFPLKTNPKYDMKSIKILQDPVLVIDCLSKTLTCGDMKPYRPKFKAGKSKLWDFVNHLIEGQIHSIPLPRYFSPDNGCVDWKHQFDTLSRNLGGNDNIKYFIITNGESYQLTEKVVISNRTSSVRALTNSSVVDYETTEDPESEED